MKKYLSLQRQFFKKNFIMESIINKSIKNLDNNFVQDLRILSMAADTNHPFAKYCISRYIELYIQKKVDMELTKSIYKTFK